MATDFTNKAMLGKPVFVGNQAKSDLPLDARTRIETLDEVPMIEFPFIGMMFYVKDEDKFYVVKSLRGEEKIPGIAATMVPNFRVDQYEELNICSVTEGSGGANCNCDCSFTQESIQKLLEILNDINNSIDAKDKIDELTNILQNQGGGNTGGDSGDSGDDEGDSPTVDYNVEPWNPDAYTDKQIALKMALSNTEDIIGDDNWDNTVYYYNLSIEGSTYTIEDITINRNGQNEFYKIITLDNLPTKVSFYGGSYIEEVINMCNTSNVTDMYEMFSGCGSLISINTNNFDTSNATNMGNMFSSCTALTTIGDISSWNTSNVTRMASMFIRCKSLTSLNISNWNTSKVTDMSSMFYGCEKLTELNISNWNYINININFMANMFYSCSSLELSNIKMDNCSQDIKTKITTAHSRRNSYQ